MNIFSMKKRMAAMIAAAMITTTFIPMGEIAMAENQMEKKIDEKAGLFGLGRPNDDYAAYFVGQSYLNVLTSDRLITANVTFEPGCRNNWHIHHKGGQILLCTAGRGYYQEWGKEPIELRPGSVVNIPPEVKHWHGAAPDSWFAHVAIEVPAEGASNEWCEPVSDSEYNALK